MSRLKSNPRAAVAAGVGALVLVLAAAWLLVVSPKRDEAATLKQDVAAKQVELETRKAELAHPAAGIKVKASDLYRLTKALPDGTDMAGVLLDVNRLAAKNKLSLQGVTPGSPVLETSSVRLPITVIVQGRFSSVSRFLGDVRSLVRVRGHQLDARGRAYSVSQIDLGAADEVPFPVVKATITLDAHTFTKPAPAAPSTTETPTTTTSSGTVAAGETP